jgi:hypothetical protein
MELTKQDIDFFVSCLRFLLHTKGKKVNPKTVIKMLPKPKRRRVRVRLEKAKPEKKLDSGLVFISSKNPMPPVTNRIPINWG